MTDSVFLIAQDDKVNKQKIRLGKDSINEFTVDNRAVSVRQNTAGTRDATCKASIGTYIEESFHIERLQYTDKG